MNMEELTKVYSDACMRAVEDAIHELANKWDSGTKNYLREQGYAVCAELYNDSLCVYAYLGKDDYFGPIKYEDDALNEAIQEVFDALGAQVVLNAMIYCGWEETTQTITWRIY